MYVSVPQNVVRRQLVVRGGSPGGPRQSADSFVRKGIAKIVSDTERIKTTPIHVCAEAEFLVDLQQKIGELVLSITSCPSAIVSVNTLN
jgi:hypothetical protein